MKKKPTKAHVACYILNACGPMTRLDLMRRVHIIEGKQEAFKPTSNISYFAPKVKFTEYIPTPEDDTPERLMWSKQWHKHDLQRRKELSKNSWLEKDLLIVVGKTKNKEFLYNVTDKGRALAAEYESFYGTK